MTLSFSTKADLAKQGVNWLKTNHYELISSFADMLAARRLESLETLPFEECHKLAAQSLKSMINRLDSKPFDLDEQKLLMFEALQHGLTIEYMTLTVDLLLDTIFIESKKGITSAEVRETLVAKATYFMNLLKSTMAAAFVKYNLE